MSRCMRGSSLLWWLLLLPLLLLLTGTSSSSSAVQARSLDGADQRWRDWLLVEDTAPSDVGSAPGSLVRRITPKSVFVAPNFNPGCKDGQQVDSQGKCVQIVRVDQAAHLDFLLKRFNSMFAAPPPPSKKVEKDSTGPFHVSLPLGGAEKPPETYKIETAKPHISTTTIKPVTTTSPPQLTTTTTTESPPPTTTPTQKTETTTITMPPATSFSTEATTELLNFSDESTTSRVTHETMKPSTFFTQASPTFLSSPTTLMDEIWSSHRVQTLPTTQTDLGTHRPQSSFDPHRTQEVFGSHRPQTLTTTQTDVFGSHRPQDVFGSHRPETLPATQTDVFGSHIPQDVLGSQSFQSHTDEFESHRPQTLPTTQTDVFGSHRPQTPPTTQTDIFESHRTHSPTTFNTQNPEFFFEGVHRTRPSSLKTSTATAQTNEDPDKTASFPSHTTLFTSPTLQTIQPFEGMHRTRSSSLHTTFPVPSTVKTNQVFTIKGFQKVTPSSSELSYTSTTSATTTFGESTPSEDENPQESLIFSGDSDNKKPFVIIVANNTFKRQEPAIVATDEADYDSATESTTTLGSSNFPEITTTTVLSHTNDGDFEGFGSPTTESSSDTRFGLFSSVLTPPPTVHEYSLEQFPAVEEAPSSFDKDSLDVAASFQQMNGESAGSKRTKCDSTYEVSQVRDGRIISQSSVTNCQPDSGKTTTTTPQPPLRTLAPTIPSQNINFRFPLESQTVNNRPSYIRFPEVPTASNYNTKLWETENNNNNYGADSNKQSYYWPQQWNPFPSSAVRGWPIMDRSHISSNVYRKQYYQHPVPQWMNKNSNQYSWPVGRV